MADRFDRVAAMIDDEWPDSTSFSMEHAAIVMRREFGQDTKDIGDAEIACLDLRAEVDGITVKYKLAVGAVHDLRSLLFEERAEIEKLRQAIQDYVDDTKCRCMRSHKPGRADYVCDRCTLEAVLREDADGH